MHPIELQDDVSHMESHFGPFGDSVSFGARLGHDLCLMHHTLRNFFGRTRWYSLVKRLKWKLGLVCLEIVLILTLDRSMVCVENTVCLDINSDTQYWMMCVICNLASVHLETVFVSVQDRCTVYA